MRFGSNRVVLFGSVFLLLVASAVVLSIRRALESDSRSMSQSSSMAQEEPSARAKPAPSAQDSPERPPQTGDPPEPSPNQENASPSPAPDLSVHEMTLDVSDIVVVRPLDLKEGETEEDALVRLTAELSEEIRRAIPEDLWTAREGEVSISFTGERKIIVTHTKRVHDWVIQFLSDRRGKR